ncbi:hypothetical protein PI124_g5328 [Phytophthora idaei]|nr:hypothetical protein PI124_g5328 [Phytophthora idaei]
MTMERSTYSSAASAKPRCRKRKAENKDPRASPLRSVAGGWTPRMNDVDVGLGKKPQSMGEDRLGAANEQRRRRLARANEDQQSRTAAAMVMRERS